MTIFECYVVDTRKEVVLRRETVVAEDEADAGTLLALTEEEKKLRRKDSLAIVMNDVGDFAKNRPQRIAMEKEEE